MSEHESAHEGEAHTDDGHGHGHHDHSDHYKKIWMILCGLLFVSVAGPEVAEFMPEGNARVMLVLLTAFGIAFVKAYMVMKHFMHLDVERPVVWYILTTSVVFMVLFFAGVSPDVMNHDGSRWENVAAKKAIQKRLDAGPGGHHGDESHGDHGDGHGDDHGDDHGKKGHDDGHH